MKRFIRLIIAVSGIFLSAVSFAQQVIPTPVEYSLRSERQIQLKKIDAVVDPDIDLPDEGYTIDIKKGVALLRAKSEQGLVWAKSTLKQITDSEGKVPDVKILDYPAFPIRGFMHDTGRNFRPVDMLKKEIELFATYKLNVFHWHLTDNPAWRMESRCYPQLNDPKYCPADRNPGMFYTYEDIRDVLKFARLHGVTVIPELDIPGHSQYFLTIFGVQMDSPKGMKILDALFEEFLTEIPAEDCPYIHIGSDEVRRKMDDAEGFVRHYEEILERHGRLPLVWAPGITPSEHTICQIWGEGNMDKIKVNGDYRNPYLDSSMGYLNHGNLISNIRNYYIHHMCSADKADEKALGGILCLWNDVRQAAPENIFPDNGMPVAMLPFAERAWVGGHGYGQKELMEFEQKMVWHRDHMLSAYDVRWVANAHIPWKVSLPVPMDGKEECEWVTEWGGSVNLYTVGTENQVKFSDEMKAVMKTEIYSDRDREIRAWVSFETPSRSTRRSAGIGEQGEWETGSHIYVNGKEVLPPSPWKEPGMYSYHFSTYGYPDIQNLPWTEEQLFWLREPAHIQLKKGWNTVELQARLLYKTPYWFVSFTPVEIDEEGRLTEVKDLEYRLPQ